MLYQSTSEAFTASLKLQNTYYSKHIRYMLLFIQLWYLFIQCAIHCDTTCHPSFQPTEYCVANCICMYRLLATQYAMVCTLYSVIAYTTVYYCINILCAVIILSYILPAYLQSCFCLFTVLCVLTCSLTYYDIK
ncbi:hypothetical protein BDF19DRAFT_452102 [Syncephalis fuscata]|nr:hypothetical protein BDF19DRAFT_452102 [Syncephalis fuscata]